MSFLVALVLLYISQLIYVSNRWAVLTKKLYEDAQSTRLRKVVDWKAPTPKNNLKKSSILKFK